MNRDPKGLRELANVIGREKALYLISQLPRTYCGAPGKKSWQPMLYVPKRLSPTHMLVRILGWHDAEKLVAVFGGELLKPPSCASIYRQWRDASIRRLHLERGMGIDELADWFGLCTRRVHDIVTGKPTGRIARRVQ